MPLWRRAFFITMNTASARRNSISPNAACRYGWPEMNQRPNQTGEPEIDRFLRKITELKAQGLHLRVGRPLMAHVAGRIIEIDSTPLHAHTAEMLVLQIMDGLQQELFRRVRGIELVHVVARDET